MNSILRRNFETKRMAKYDKLLLQTVMKRQYLIIEDLYNLHDNYPDKVDGDLVASFDAMYRLMRDVVERCLIEQ